MPYQNEDFLSFKPAMVTGKWFEIKKKSEYANFVIRGS